MQRSAGAMLVATLAFTLAACGDDDSPAGAPTTASTTNAAPETGGEPTTTSSPTPAWQLDATDANVDEAQRLIADTQTVVQRYATADDATDAGYIRINAKHLMNLDYMFDEFIMNAEHIESLVVDEAGNVIGGMYVMNLGDTLDDVPTEGGPLVIWHSHGRLCVTDAPALAPKNDAGECPAGTTAIDDLPMVHIWNEAQPNDDGTPRDAAMCGTFQYLDLPHETTIEGCSGQSAGGGNAITHEH